MEKTEESNLIYLSKLDNKIKVNKNAANGKEFEIREEKKRYYIFDNIKGILIFIVKSFYLN